MLHPAIEKRASAIAGFGLYAKEFIPAGAVIWEAEEDEEARFWRHVDVISTWTAEEQARFYNNAYQVAPNIYSGIPPGVPSPDESEFMNHSCDPNTVFVGDRKMVARKDIHPGDEVTYDYATSESADSRHLPFRCCCGTARCRGEITAKDCLDPAFRAAYAGHFTSMVADLHKAADAAASAAM